MALLVILFLIVALFTIGPGLTLMLVLAFLILSAMR